MKKFLVVAALFGSLALAPRAEASPKSSCDIIDVKVSLTIEGNLCISGYVEGALTAAHYLEIKVTDAVTGLTKLVVTEIEIAEDGTFSAVECVSLKTLTALEGEISVALNLLDGSGECCDCYESCFDLYDELLSLLCKL